MKKNKKLGRPRKYDFKVIRKGKWVSVPTNNILACRESAKYWAVMKGMQIITKSDGVNLLIYRL